jgi:hypothetical protein
MLRERLFTKWQLISKNFERHFKEMTAELKDYESIYSTEVAAMNL